MPSDRTRRRYLVTAGAALTATLAGCQSLGAGGGATGNETSSTTGTNGTSTSRATSTSTGNATGPTNSDALPPDPNPNDGYPPEFKSVPEKRSFDPASFPTVTRNPNGTRVAVPLVPLDVAYNLYARHEARFVDTRPKTGFDVSHVLGAVRSPPPTGRSGDPTVSWDPSKTVVTYCQCPTYDATERAAYLLDGGFQQVFALQGGYQGWEVANYPMDGSGVPATAPSWTITGRTKTGDAGGVAYVFHDATGQVAGTTVAGDGSFSIDATFAGAKGGDQATVGTPSYKVDGSLSSLAGRTITGSGGSNGTAGGGSSTSTGSASFDLGRFAGLIGR